MENKPQTKNEQDNSIQFAFGKANYILMVAGLILLAIGYILLAGGGSDDPNVFNPAMFDNRRLFAAPILIVLGFVVEIVAIMYKDKK
jgi:predicted membrane protein